MLNVAMKPYLRGQHLRDAPVSPSFQY